MSDLSVDQLSYRVGDRVLVNRASFQIRAGDFVALLGPNGAGKTSLVNAAMGFLPIDSGQATLGGRDCASLSPTERARNIAYLPQQRDVAWPLTVRDVVAIGRYSYGTGLGFESDDDRRAIDKALEACDLRSLAGRRVDTLSGGEASRVHCARALCAGAPLLIADEPTAALDPRHAFELMDIFKAYVASGGAVLVILHDLALAARYVDKLLWMKDGEIVASGPVESTLSENLCAEVYGVRARIHDRSVELLESL